MSRIRISGAQLDFKVGAINENKKRILEAYAQADEAGSDLVVFPELALTGYPPEDLLLNKAFIDENLEALKEIAEQSRDFNAAALVGFADKVEPGTYALGIDAEERGLANAIAVIAHGEIIGVVHKTLLPTYGVFDEARYFSASRQPFEIFSVGDVNFGVPICEDLWREGVADQLVKLGADLLIVPNASPYHHSKADQRAALAASTAKRVGVPLLYLASVGGQDELVFDGSSILVEKDGSAVHRSPVFKEELFHVDLELAAGGTKGSIVSTHPRSNADYREGKQADRPSEEEEVYLALVTGLKSYIEKNGFKDVILGLSGGIDSALVAALAADALGGSRVWGVGMPGPYSSGGSVTDARDLAERLGCRFDVLSIKELYEAELRILHGTEEAPGPFAGTAFNSSEENLQARLRMTLIMSLSNKHGNLLLTTGNKSETSVGYCTLYGDTAGGFAPIKDVYKTLVFDLCQWRNSITDATIKSHGWLGTVNPIPENTLTKPPSAELAPGQSDDQSLPPYPVLDGILERYIEKIMSPSGIAEDGFDVKTVERVCRLVDMNEYKRRQAAPGVKITRRSFGRDRRLPITNGWRPSVSEAVKSAGVSVFVTKAEVESVLSSKLNALGISAWWDSRSEDLGGATPASLFGEDPDRVAELARNTVKR